MLATGSNNRAVSLVDGFNLPVRISNNGGCPVADCPKDLNRDCPAPLKGPFDASGNPVGCKTACFANLDGHPEDSANCCSGSHNVPATCPPSGVQYYDYFSECLLIHKRLDCPDWMLAESNCPNSYAYAYDESSGTALFKCPASKKVDYTITFCP